MRSSKLKVNQLLRKNIFMEERNRQEKSWEKSQSEDPFTQPVIWPNIDESSQQ